MMLFSSGLAALEYLNCPASFEAFGRYKGFRVLMQGLCIEGLRFGGWKFQSSTSRLWAPLQLHYENRFGG